MKIYFLPMLLSLFFLGACDKNDEIIPCAEGRLVVKRAQVIAVMENRADSIEQGTYEFVEIHYPDGKIFFVTDPFDTVIKKLYG